MIVNPQLFNYRLIISSLIVAIAVLSVFSFGAYKSIEKDRNFLETEKKLVESELSQMISRYDALEIENSDLEGQLEFAKINTKIALDSLKLLNSDLSVIMRYKKRLYALQKQNASLTSDVQTLVSTNQNLIDDNEQTSMALSVQRNKNTVLENENAALNSTINEASLLTANSFKASAYTMVLGKKVATNKASKASAIDVCFTLAENMLSQKGKKDIYIQIVGPNNNILSDKGAIKFGNSTLIYSLKTSVNYNNKVMDLCKSVKPSNNESLMSGTYFVNVFHQGKRLGSTKIRLK